MRRGPALVLTIVLASVAAPAALERNKAAYAGGTITAFDTATHRIEGRLDLDVEHHLVFTPDEQTLAGEPLRIAYATIQDVQFGQKVERRVAAATVTTALLGPVGLLAFLSKTRAHYVTVAYTDEEGRNQVAIFELGADLARPTLAAIEKQVRMAIEYQDEKARKWNGGRSDVGRK